MTATVCAYCGKEIMRFNYQLKHLNFCNSECQHKHQSKIRKGIPPSYFIDGTIPEAIRVRIGASNKIALKGINSGSKHPNWQGGKTSLNKQIRRSDKYMQWRSDVFKRDGWTCQTCRARGYVEAHHKKELIKIVKENNIVSLDMALSCKELWDIDNGVTLCKACHGRTKGRPYDFRASRKVRQERRF